MIENAINTTAKNYNYIDNIKEGAVMKRMYGRIDGMTKEEIDFDVDPQNGYRTSLFTVLQESGEVFPWHWHTEVECFYVQKGTLTLHVLGQEYLFREDDVGFVNSGVLHMLSLEKKESFRLQNHIFLPKMICGEDRTLEARYVMPLVRNSAAPLLMFRRNTEEARQIRNWMNEAYAAHTQEIYGRELIVRDCMSRIWALFAANMPDDVDSSVTRDAHRLMVMLEYIAAHYSEKIDLRSLSEAAHISSKECERCFRKQIRMTPFEYIVEYRLERARALLQQYSADSITEIGQRCGFATTSYFGKCFKQKYGMSPKEYRAGIHMKAINSV